MVCTGKVELGKPPSPSKPVQQLFNKLQQILVLNREIIEALIVDAQPEKTF